MAAGFVCAAMDSVKTISFTIWPGKIELQTMIDGGGRADGERASWIFGQTTEYELERMVNYGYHVKGYLHV